MPYIVCILHLQIIYITQFYITYLINCVVWSLEYVTVFCVDVINFARLMSGVLHSVWLSCVLILIVCFDCCHIFCHGLKQLCFVCDSCLFVR